MLRVCVLLVCLAVAQAATVNNIGYKWWLRSGDQYTKEMKPLNPMGIAFGQAIDQNGKACYSLDTKTPYYVAQDPDFTSILKPAGGSRIFSISSFEWTNPSSMYISELVQDPKTGVLEAISSRPVDWSKWGNLIATCAGSQSPWGSHLQGEEVDPDAKIMETSTSWATLPSDLQGDVAVEYSKYFSMYNITAPTTLPNGINAMPLDFATFKAKFNPYNYGHAFEAAVNKDGAVAVRKLLVFGRMRFEGTWCHPNGRVCYSGDDTYGGVMTKVVLNKKNDPRAGTLYAAKLTTVDPSGGGKFAVEWVRLGASHQNNLKYLLDSGLKFSDIFEAAKYNASTKGCNDNTFKPIYSGVAGFECLKLKDTKIAPLAAAFFETRRYAAYMGATTEHARIEGMGFDLVGNSVIFTYTGVDRGALANSSYDVPTADHMKLTAANPCGCVYQGKMDAQQSITSIEAIVCGFAQVADSFGNTCDVNGISSPDNIAVIPNTSTIIIYEDTSRHQINMQWAMDLKKGVSSLTRIGTQMYGAEWTSGNYVRNINGWDYLVAVMQHPYDNSEGAKRIMDWDSTGKAAYVGYTGPYPTSAMKGEITFSKVPVPEGPAKHKIITSQSVQTSA